MLLIKFLNNLFKQDGFLLEDANEKEHIIGKPKLEEGEELLVVEEFPSERPGFGLRYYKKLSE